MVYFGLTKENCQRGCEKFPIGPTLFWEMRNLCRASKSPSQTARNILLLPKEKGPALTSRPPGSVIEYELKLEKVSTLPRLDIPL